MIAWPQRLVAGAVLTAVLAGGLVVAAASPAQAHGRGTDATNYRTTITAPPDLPGVSWEVYGGDELLEVVNTSDTELIISGYEAAGADGLEEYARIGPDGVFVNVHSRAYYLNDDRYSQVTVPPAVEAGAPPEWEKVSDSNAFAWHDHRTHWMSPTTDPPALKGRRDERVVVFDEWEVEMWYGDREEVLAGTLEWIPGPNPWRYVAIGSIPALIGLVGLRTSPVGGRWPGLARPAAAVLGVAVALNVTHLVDDVFYAPFDMATKTVAVGQTALFLAIATFAVVRGWQAREGAFTALAVGSVAVLVGQGLLYLPVVWVSQNASLFPDGVSRVIVVYSLAQALPVVLAAVVGTRSLLPPRDEQSAAADPVPT